MRSSNRIANCPIAAVDSMGCRQWTPALWIAKNKGFVAASPLGRLLRCCPAWNRDLLEPNNVKGLERRSAPNTHAEQRRGPCCDPGDIRRPGLGAQAGTRRPDPARLLDILDRRLRSASRYLGDLPCETPYRCPGTERRAATTDGWRHRDLRNVNEVLDAILADSQFDLGRVEQRPNGPIFTYSQNSGEIVSPGALQGLAASPSWGDEAAARARCAKIIVPNDAFARWRSADATLTDRRHD